MTSAPTGAIDKHAERLSRPTAWLRARVTTTPGRLRLIAGLLAVALIVFGIVAAAAAGSRRSAAHAAAKQTEPLLVQSDVLYSSLSDADATATTTFLTGGIESTARRQRYLGDMRTASVELTTLAQEVDSPEARVAVSTIATNLPLYSGYVETARADNREGFPIGAAYLRQASTVMRDKILPASEQVYEIEAHRLAADYEAGISTGTFLVVVAGALVALLLLIVAQAYLARLSNRVFNIPLVIASLVLLGLTVWALAGFEIEQNALSRAQRNGSDSVEVLSATRILLLRAQSDESLALVARGGGDEYTADFDAVMKALGRANGSSGLLADAAKLARRTGSTASFADVVSTLRRYRAVHRRIGALEGAGRFVPAVALAVGHGTTEAGLARRLDADLESQIAAAQSRFEHAAADATSSLRALWPGILLLTISAVALTLFGFALRTKEYR